MTTNNTKKMVAMDDLMVALQYGDLEIANWKGYKGFELAENKHGEIVKRIVMDSDVTVTRLLVKLQGQQDYVDRLEYQKKNNTSYRAKYTAQAEIDDMRSTFNKMQWYCARVLSTALKENEGRFLFANLKKLAEEQSDNELMRALIEDQLKLQVNLEITDLMNDYVARSEAARAM